ncbi:MAG TPA: translation initiation factor [Opitutaceae bacterium]
MSNPSKISTDGGQGLGHNPFAGLSGAGLPDAAKLPLVPPEGAQTLKAEGLKAEQKTALAKSRGRVDILREKAGRGGKTVTVVTGWIGIGLPEKESLAKKMQKACGVGGTVKDGRIEIQGDKRDEVARILTEAGFRPVFAGG